MIVRDDAYQRIDELDDAQIVELLSFLDELAADRDGAPTTGSRSLSSLTGIGRSIERTNIAEKEDYLADAYDVNRR